MAGWFSRIIKGGERAGADPVDFALTCRCGQMVTGLRSKRMHVAVCRACGFQICVLPVSPYPRPKIRPVKKKPVKPPPLSKRSRELDDDSGMRTPPPPIPKRGTRSGSPSTRKVAGVPAGQRRGSKPDSNLDEPLWRTSPRKLITPLRITAAGMIVVIALAGWWVVRQKAKAAAVVAFADAAKAARVALASEQFDQAEHHLARAVQSLDLLGRDDREARQIRQQAREATAANHLAPISLFDLLSEARQTQKMAGKDWHSVLRSSYQGDWFLLESNGLSFPDDAKRPLAFTVTLVPGDEPIQVRGDLSKWARQVSSGELPKHFILAGQLQDIRALSDGKGWEIVLQDDSIFLWANPETYTPLGGILDETTTATLKAQGKMLGVVE